MGALLFCQFRVTNGKLKNEKISDINNSTNLTIFKNKIRKWEPKECHCYLCQPYVRNLGFVNLV